MRTETDHAENFGNKINRLVPGKAKADHFSINAVTENTDHTFILDVMLNDRGGKAKSLWSIDDGISTGGSDLLTRDTADVVESSALGAHISITRDGKVAYTYTPELRAKFVPLSADESLTDTFTYAIRLSNGVLGWATATVEIAGVNDPPVLSGTLNQFVDGEVNASYMILESDLLIGISDFDSDALSVADLVATNGVLTEMQGGWLFTPNSDFVGTIDLQYNVIDSHGGSLPVNQNFNIINPPDTTAPQLVSTFPGDEGILKVDNNIELHFDEGVVAGSGAIIISNGVDTRVIDINDTSQVTFISGEKGGSSIIIDPTEDLITDTNYNIQIARGVIRDASNNVYEGISDTETLNFMTTVSEPLLQGSNPWDEGILKADSSIELYFDEAVAAGTGAIIISNGSDTRTIDIQDASQVTFDGYGGVIINPTDDLIPDTNYYIQIAAGAILDLDGHPYAGISDTETLNFMTTVSEPLLQGSNPWDEEILKADGSIELYFDEAVVAGSGTIIISNGTDTRTIDIQDTSQVTFDGYSGIIIDPADDLIPDTNYYIQISAGAIMDLDGHAYAGISDTETLNFMTTVSEPLLQGSTPWDEGTLKVGGSIALHFDEAVVAGSGTIIISNGSDTRTIDINDPSQVTFAGGKGGNSIIIDPTDDLIPDTNYYIQISAGAILDLDGHAYAGISDTETLDFITTGSGPLLNWSNPGDEGILKVDNNIELHFDEAVVAGSGAIIISNGSDTRTIDIQDTSQVTFASSKHGNSIIIDPTEDLIVGTSYHVQIAPGAILDNEGNTYAGINNPDTLNFTTIDPSPQLSFSSPGDDEADVWVGNDIYFYFDEMVNIGTGNITISNGTDIRTIHVQDSNQVMFDGYSSLSINPAIDLVPNTDYFIQMDTGVVTDMDGNPYAGIHDTTTLNFSTTDIQVDWPMVELAVLL